MTLSCAGWSAAAHDPRRVLPPRQYVEQLRHQRTLRGHHFAVYCIAFDRSGRYVITGSDDHLVKVCWYRHTYVDFLHVPCECTMVKQAVVPSCGKSAQAK